MHGNTLDLGSTDFELKKPDLKFQKPHERSWFRVNKKKIMKNIYII